MCNSEQLKNVLIKICNEISIEMVKRLYLSTADKLEQVIQLKGFLIAHVLLKHYVFHHILE